MIRRTSAMLTVIAVLLFFSYQAIAQEGRIQIGKLKVVPSISLQVLYDDNLFLGNGENDTAELEDDDLITSLKPGLMFEYSLMDRGAVRLGFNGEFAFYSDYDDNDWRNIGIPFSIDYKAPKGLFFAFSNTYNDAEDPFGSLTEYNLGQITERWTDNLTAHLGYGVGDGMKVIGYYNYNKQDYDDDADFSQDYDDFELGAGFEYRFLPKTWGFVRYHYGARDHFTHPAGSGSTESNDADYDWHRLNLGLTWDASAKLSGELNFGYKWSNWDNVADLQGRVFDDEDTWVAATALSYKATERTTIGVNLARELRITGSDSVDYFEDTSFGVSLQQAILDKFTIRAGATYQVQDYNLGGREDDNINLNLGVDYKINRWFTTGGGYSYKTKDSSTDNATDNFGRNNEYDDNQFFIKVSAVY